MVEANIGESPRGSRPKVFPRTRSSGGARATPRHRDRASPTVAFAPRRSSSPRAAPVRPSRRAVPTLSRPDRSKPKRNSSSKLTARFFPPASPFPNRSAVSRPARREALAPRRPAGPMERPGRLRRRQGAPPRLWRHGRRRSEKVRRGSRRAAQAEGTVDSAREGERPQGALTVRARAVGQAEDGAETGVEAQARFARRATGDLGPGEGHAPKAGTGLAGGQVPRG